MVKKKSPQIRILTEREQQYYLDMILQLIPIRRILKILHVAPNVIWETKKQVPEFLKAVQETNQQLAVMLENKAWKTAMEGSFTCKTTKVAKIGPDGKNELDEDGKPIWAYSKREITRTDNSDYMLRFMLAARMPEVYSNKVLQPEKEQPALDLKELLHQKLNELEAKEKEANGEKDLA